MTTINLDRRIQKQVSVPASLDEVWQAWTTAEGCQTFFAPVCNVELRIGGPYEMLFDLDAPPGQQGGEGLTVLSFLPQTMLSFSWNAPPRWPEERGQLTWVVVQLEEAGGGTRVTLTHLGWREGGNWEEVYGYFVSAWDTVLGRLQRRLEVGPIDWSTPWRPPA